MEGLRLDFPLLLQMIHNVLVAPTDFMRQALLRRRKINGDAASDETMTHLHCAVFTTRLQPQDPQCLRHDHPLLPVIWRRDTLKKLQAFKSRRATSGLVWYHAADGPEENLGRRAVMERTRFFGVNNVALVQKVVVAQLGEAWSSKCRVNGAKTRAKAPCCGRSCQRC